MISVADRFSFTETEIRTMPLSRLDWWYEAVRELYEKEKQESNGSSRD